jgi:hypothetical protein
MQGSHFGVRNLEFKAGDCRAGRIIYTFNMKTFAEVVERADSLSQDEREELIRILQGRLREERREQLLQDVEESRKAIKSETTQSASIDEIMRRIRE